MSGMVTSCAEAWEVWGLELGVGVEWEMVERKCQERRRDVKLINAKQ